MLAVQKESLENTVLLFECIIHWKADPFIRNKKNEDVITSIRALEDRAQKNIISVILRYCEPLIREGKIKSA